jgi:hypothetical protein
VPQHIPIKALATKPSVGCVAETEDGNYLVVEHGWQQCQLVAGDAIVPLPAWAQSITK